ncbi:MAG: DNA alkylation repair protein [Planktomarina sp.]
MDVTDAIDTLISHRIDGKAADMAKYHKVDRTYLGVANPALDDAARDWRRTLPLDERLELASDLWVSDIHEARVCAAKLLTQARIKPDDNAAWTLIQSWVPDFDSWAIADHVCMAGQRRLTADPSRLDVVESWTQSDHMWTKRAAMVITLPWTKIRNPKSDDLEAQERILGWAAEYVPDHTWFIQKSISWWLRELSRKNPGRVAQFIAIHGDQMRASARKDAVRLMLKSAV